MSPDVAEAGFLDFSAGSRALVGGCALLLVADLHRADRLSQTVLARRAAATSSPRVQLVRALRELVHPRPAFFEPPWAAGSRVELRDGGPAVATPALLGELQQLPHDLRAAVVLRLYAGLTAAEVGDVLGTGADTVESWVGQAVGTLAVLRPDRLQPGRLAAELRTCAAAAVVSGTPADDLANGRRLVRRARTRRAAAAVAAALVVLLVAVTGLDRDADVPQAVSTPATAPPTPTGPPRVTAACDVRNPSCQATVMRQWRSTMSEVVVSHLDPDGAYFTGYSFSYDPRYESRTFWAGGEGALGLEVFRLTGGATVVYLQVASGYDTAVRCGATTRHRCEGQRFLDGNRFTLSTTTQVGKGIEVQHRPDGDQVVTVVARNTTRGRVLPVTRADLIRLVQDPRLRLPVI
nr:sigma factor-like helix-turn-helix DNA-binding protein [uncultured Friedmanniella sp.]